MDEPVPSWSRGSRSPAEPSAGGRAGALGGAARLRRALAGLGCSRAELLALGMLGVAALAALGLLAAAIGGGPAVLSRLAAPVPAEPTSPAQTLQIETEPPAGLVVHVAGRVAAPGVHHLPGGARVGDALAAAGGALADAALDALNLARPLADGEQLVVPAVGDPAATPLPAPAAPEGVGPGAAGPLDLNRATQAELEALPGVGPVLAGRILDHRDRVGGRFSSVGDLRDVPGIGEGRFQSIAELVRV